MDCRYKYRTANCLWGQSAHGRETTVRLSTIEVTRSVVCVFFAGATPVYTTVNKTLLMLRITHRRGVHMDQDRFTRMAGDLARLGITKICNQWASLSPGVHGPGVVTQSNHPISFNLDGP